MTTQENTVPTCIVIVEPAVNVGITFADWLLAQGYQAVLVRSVGMAIEKLRDLCPRVVFVGSGPFEPEAQFEISEILRLIRIVCPGVPILTIVDWANEDVRQIVFRHSVDHVLGTPVREGFFKRT